MDSAFEILYCTTKPCLVVEFGTSGTTCASAGVRRYIVYWPLGANLESGRICGLQIAIKRC